MVLSRKPPAEISNGKSVEAHTEGEVRSCAYCALPGQARIGNAREEANAEVVGRECRSGR